MYHLRFENVRPIFPNSDSKKVYIPKLSTREVKTTLGLSTLLRVVLPKEGRDKCPSSSKRPTK